MSERGENSAKDSTGGVADEHSRARSAVTRVLYDVMQTLYAVRAEWCGDGHAEACEALGDAISRVAALASDLAPEGEAAPPAQDLVGEVASLKAILRDLIAAYDLSAVVQLVMFDEMTQVRRELSLAEQDTLKGLQYAYTQTGAAVGEVRKRAEEALKP